MLSLLKDSAITALIIILNHIIYGVEPLIAYDFVVEFIAQRQTLFLVIGIFGSALLIIFSSMFEGLGIYKITYGVSRVSVRVCQFFITFLSILNVAFYFALDANLMQSTGYMALFALVLFLVSSCWSLRMIDFNHPTPDVLAPVGILAFLSVILVQFIWPLYF